MTTQPQTLYAAILAADFPAQAILRLRPDLKSQPVAILEGIAPQETVCSLNLPAKKRGVVQGMTRLDVEELTDIHILSRFMSTELAARNVLLECVSQFSPRVEETIADNACGFVLDISGTERLFGPPMALAQSLHASITATGFRASVCLSSNFDTARIKAETSHGITVIAQDKEASSIADIPVSVLGLDDQNYETLVLWGIRTLGELAELPDEELVIRLGQQSHKWLQLSRGISDHTFKPLEAEFELREHFEFETHIEQLDSLLFIGATMISTLIARATSRALSLSTLTIRMSLERSVHYERVIRPALPSSDHKFLLKLLQLEMASYPPLAPIKTLTLIAEAGQSSKVQLGLFTPQAPEPTRLDVTLARLRTLVGTDRVGSPILSDSHRRDSFSLEPFAVRNQPASQPIIGTHFSLHRIRPPHPLQIKLQLLKPIAFLDGTDKFEVHVAYGPWHSSGCWWDVNEWDLAEWDVMATNKLGESVGCLIVHDLLHNEWLLDAYYD
jgi:protein ImuB